MNKQIDREKVKKLVEKGMSDSQIAEQLDCHKVTIGEIRRDELGIKRSGGNYRNQYETMFEFLNLLICKPYVTKTAASKIIGCERTYIYKMYKRLKEKGFPIFKRSYQHGHNSNNNERITMYCLDPVRMSQMS